MQVIGRARQEAMERRNHWAEGRERDGRVDARGPRAVRAKRVAGSHGWTSVQETCRSRRSAGGAGHAL